MKPIIGRLHVLTDTTLQSNYSHPDLARLAIDGGADTIQYREKNKTSLEMFRDAEKIVRICRDAGVTMLVNDRIDIAIAVDADGVHLGQSDIPIATAREVLGHAKLIGGSATNFDELQSVIDSGADYVGFGPVFGTMSKENPGAPKGIDFMKKVVEKSTLPVIAIGGIKLSHVHDLFRTGIHGIAVISAICCDPDPVEATKTFMEVISNFHEL